MRTLSRAILLTVIGISLCTEAYAEQFIFYDVDYCNSPEWASKKKIEVTINDKPWHRESGTTRVCPRQPDQIPSQASPTSR